ncbi:hypothetical protein GF380_00735, partial [Candidatus Uhrbacteria bacterium]|nr:hypothetical protein [Candidatus Uhrbacteria bacterium]
MRSFEQPTVRAKQEESREVLADEYLERFENREVAERLIAAFDDFKAEYGTTGAQALIKKLNEQQTLQTEDLAEVMEQIPPREEFKEKVINLLIKEGCLRKYRGQLIADLDKLRTLIAEGDFRQKAHAFRGDGRFGPYFKQSFAHGIYDALEDVEVISTEDWRAKDRTPKPLFYQPDPVGGPYDIDEIREDQSYLGCWELMFNRQTPKDLPYPGQPASETFNDVSIAAMIYHPRYGNGYRDEDGTLQVYNSTKNKHEPISSEWFTNIMHYAGGDRRQPGESLHTPVEFLQKYGEQLKQWHILEPKDFRQQTVRQGAEIQTARVERNKISSRGTVMFNGVMHYLGRKFASQPVRVVELGPHQGGIFTTQPDGSEQLTHTFTIIDRDQPELKQWKSGKNEYGYAGAELTNVQPVTESTPREQELPKSTEQMLKVSRLLQQKANIRIADLSPTMQGWIAESIQKLDPEAYDQLGAYAKKFGIDGIKALVSSEDPNAMLGLSEHLGPPLTRTVLKRYNDVLKTAERETDELLKDIFINVKDAPPMERQRIEQALIKRASVAIRDAEKAVGESPKA